jgi:CRP/FNR family cyclic AMP-dependent transcriptional regulator
MTPVKKTKSPLAGDFNVQGFLESAGVARTIVEFQVKDTIFSQGDIGKDVLYVQKGTVKLSVVSKTGKEAVVAMLKPGNFMRSMPSRIVSSPTWWNAISALKRI